MSYLIKTAAKLRKMDHVEIIAYLNGHADAQERTEMEAWIKASAENEAVFKSIEAVWAAAENNASPARPNVDAAWKKVYGRTVAKQKGRILPLVWRRAAAAILFILASYTAYTLLERPALETFVANEYEIPARVELEDGTSVWLNRDSRLIFPKKFGRRNRKVQLVGEGYFQVERAEDWPFLVEAGGSQTRVLGTSFNIRAYPDSNRVHLFVNSGKVAFSTANESDNESAILEKNQGAVYLRNKNQVTKLDTITNQPLAWWNQELVYDQAELRQVFSDLEELFGVEFQVEGESLLNCLFSGRLRTGRLQEILDILEFTFEFELKTLSENKYQVSGEGCT